MDVRTPVTTIDSGLPEAHLERWREQVAALEAAHPGVTFEKAWPRQDRTDLLTLAVPVSAWVSVVQHLKAAGYDFLTDLTATDEVEDRVDPRFDVVVHLFSTTTKARIRVKTGLKDGEECPTLTGLWASANWAEREVFDMFGVRFKGHPDLRRILMDERWEGHPLRKDYPLRGYQIFPQPQEIQESLLN